MAKQKENTSLTMSDSTNRGVCDKLDIDDVEPIKVEIPKISIDKENPINDAIHDYEFIRAKSIKNISICESILDHTLRTMNCELSPRHMEACSQLVDTSMKCSKYLIEIHEKLKKLRIKDDKPNEENTAEKIVGSVSDVVKLLKNEI